MTITLDRVCKAVGGRTLVEDVSLSFSSPRHYGLTGPNGAGKSTILRMIMGLESPTAGSISRPQRIGFLKQNIDDFRAVRLIDVVIMGNARLWNAFERREALHQLKIDDAIGMELGKLEEIIGDEDGYSAEANAEALLRGVGIPESYFHGPLGAIPLDMQFRALLCQALFGEPNALLLDEPTNHLDLESIGWLEQFLKAYPGTCVVVSHDRHFLNAVTTDIADIDYETIIVYPGNYDEMVVTKASVRSRAEDEAKTKEKKVVKLREFVDRFRSGTRASQVQSRLREIEKLQPQELKKSNIQRPYIRFIPSEKSAGKIALTARSIAKSYEGKPVIHRFSCEIMRGDKIGVIGNNGLGKTTLLKMLAQVLAPDSGQVVLGHNVCLSYFPQNHGDIIDKQGASNLFDWLKSRAPSAYDQDIRGVLGKLLFAGDDAFKKVNMLSGGETARLLLGNMLLQEHNLIILDEPNNHLDLEAVSSLGWALDEYKGTAIVASHDRDLLRFAKKIISFDKHGIEIFDGTLEEFFKVKQKVFV